MRIYIIGPIFVQHTYLHQQRMKQLQKSSKKPEETQLADLKLYIFGSCESDQYYHPTHASQSKRPICLSDIKEFSHGDEDDEQEEGKEERQSIPNPLFGVKIANIACGALHTIVATNEGKVFTFGCNDEGALGREGAENIPIQVSLLHPIDLISAGDNHSIFASSAGGAIYFTGNYKYLRGQKMVDPIKVPQFYDINEINNRYNAESKLTKVVSGSNHSAILIAGRVFIRGEPEAHTVGRRVGERNKLKNSLTFEGVGLNNVKDLWCGGYHTIAKVKRGTGWAYHGWGLNKHGQLGIGSYKENLNPVQIKKLRNMDVVEVAAGTNFSVFLLEDGQIFGCGQNDEGQLGLGEGYEFVDSEKQQEQEVEAQIAEKIPEQPKPQVQVNSENPENPPKSEQNHHQPENPPQPQQNHHQPEKPRLIQENIYIKSIRPIPLEARLKYISAGSQFVYGWNDQGIYSWGFGMNYVLLNGNEQNQQSPFRVKLPSINEQRIHQLVGGAQHVAYLACPKTSRIAKIGLNQQAKIRAANSRNKSNRKKRSPSKA